MLVQVQPCCSSVAALYSLLAVLVQAQPVSLLAVLVQLLYLLYWYKSADTDGSSARVGWDNDARPWLLCVEDPNKPDSDLGKNR